MPIDRYYVDQRLVVRTNINLFIAGPFDTELLARKWLDGYFETKADELMRLIISITERQLANLDAMELCGGTSKET